MCLLTVAFILVGFLGTFIAVKTKTAQVVGFGAKYFVRPRSVMATAAIFTKMWPHNTLLVPLGQVPPGVFKL